jgi:hypothetical protein
VSRRLDCHRAVIPTNVEVSLSVKAAGAEPRLAFTALSLFLIDDDDADENGPSG